jgi:hypothetical protein
MNVLDYNHCNSENCRHAPNCGWNITLGGENNEELMELKTFLKSKIEKDFTDYKDKPSTEKFGEEI